MKSRSVQHLRSINIQDEYGQQIKVVQKQAAVISPVDFSRHIYTVGGTGSGKTSLIREIAKHLEESNRNETFPNSFIYLDPKGDDSLKFIQQCNEQSISNGTIHFLDPIKTNFSINPLELLNYSQDQRAETVSRYVGYFMEIVKEWYGQQQTFVQMERIFRVLLFYMYLKNDAPTFLDMYDIIINLQEEREKFLQVMFKALEINGVVFEGNDLPECFRIKSPSACYLPVPEDPQLAELKIIGINIWGGTSIEILPELPLRC